MAGSRPDEDDAQVPAARKMFQRILGRELQDARKAYGLTLRSLAAQLPPDVTHRCLETYESGSRPFSVARYVEWCARLDVNPGELINRATAKANAYTTMSVTVDLAKLAYAPPGGHEALRRWARAQLASNGTSRTATLDGATLDVLATALGCTHGQLLGHLTAYLFSAVKV